MSMNRSTREDPLKQFNFIIVFPGIKRYGFEFCSGISWNAEAIPYREGTTPLDSPMRSAGLSNYEPITLRRGLIIPTDGVEGSFELEHWVTQVRYKDPRYRRNGSIILLNNDKTEGATYDLINAWPSSWKPFSELNSTGNANVTEELVLVYEHYERKGSSISPPAPGQTIAPLLGLG